MCNPVHHCSTPADETELAQVTAEASDADTEITDSDKQLIYQWVYTSSQMNLNSDYLIFNLSHAYDCFLDARADHRIKTRKNWVPASSDEDLVMRSKCENKV